MNSEAAALTRSLRSRTLLLGLLCVAAASAAVWELNRPGGRGADEVPHRVMVVARGDDDFAMLEQAGFEIGVARFGEWQERATKVVGTDEGPQALLELADELGFGFVVFEDPDSLDFSEIDFEGDRLEGGPRFAVLSVGDLAMPRHLTVERHHSELISTPEYFALQALYAQPRFDPEREILIHKPTVDELNLQHRIEPGLNLLQRALDLEVVVEEIASDVATALGHDGATPVAVAFESGGALPMPDGGLLSITQELRISSLDARTLEYEHGNELRIDYVAHPFGAEARTPCLSLGSGRIDVGAFPELASSPDGSSILLSTRSAGTALFVLNAAPPRHTDRADTCPYRRLGAVDMADDERELGVPMGTRVARRTMPSAVGESLIVREAGAPQALRFPMLPAVQLGTPVWLGQDHLVALGRQSTDDGAHDAMYLFSTADPSRVYRYDAQWLRASPRGLAALPGGAGLVVLAGQNPSSLFRLELDVPSHGSEPQDADTSVIVDLSPETLRATELRLGAEAYEPSVSPDGRHVAFAYRREGMVGPGIAVVELVDEDGEADLRLLTQGDYADARPRFTADGSAVVFQRRVPVSVGSRALAAPLVIGRD